LPRGPAGFSNIWLLALNRREVNKVKKFTEKAHRDALLRRRIKFVVEKGAMARLFKGSTSHELQKEVFRQVRPEKIALIRSCEEYNSWLISLIKKDWWEPYSRNGLNQDRWGYFAKLLNILNINETVINYVC